MDINKIKLNNGITFIEASAGTGKSFTLSHIVLRNIFERNINPENILLLSFTNNTCKELRAKIIERLDTLENFVRNKEINNIDITLINWYDNFKKNLPEDIDIFNYISNIKDDINKITITTFHGLCKNIIDEFSIELSTKLASKVDNNIEDLYINIINELWIEEYFKLESDMIKIIENKKISTKYNNKEINSINKKLFIRLLKEIDQDNICKYSRKDKDILDINEYMRNYITVAWDEFSKEWYQNGENLFRSLINIGNSIEKKGFKSKIYSANPRNKYKKINDWISEVNKEFNDNDRKKIIFNILKEDLLSKYFYIKTILKETKKYGIDIDLSNYTTLQSKIYKLKDGFFNEFIRIFLDKAYLKLIQLKENKNILNYSDLIKTIEIKYLNKNNKEERSIKFIKNKYQCVLIDEFQDTDNIQWNIIKRLFYDSKHFLLCVGDPKQAIYKFRGGDIETYLKAKSDSEKIYTLVNNYRTSKELIEIINSIYKKGLLDSELKYPKLLAKNNLTLDIGPVFQIIEFSENDVILEEYIINYLIELIINYKKVDLNKVAILTLYNYQCKAISDLLSNNNIPSNIINKNNIFDTESSQLLDLLLNCLSSPYSLKNILLLATSKFIQIENNKFENIENIKEIDNISLKCKEWSKNLNEIGFINLVNELINEFKSPLIINDHDLMDNLFQLSEIIEKELIKNNYNLNNLINWYQNELNEEKRKLLDEEYFIKGNNQTRGINISTIHSSKGLEYDVVICPYLWDVRKNPKKSKGPIWKDNKKRKIYLNIEESHPKVQYLKSIEEKDSKKESERLIYVALTRAKYKLVIFNNIDNKENILNKNLLSNLQNNKKFIYKSKFNKDKASLDFIKNKYKENISYKSPWHIYQKTKKTNNGKSINEIISRSSYSSWTRSDINSHYYFKDYEDKPSKFNDKVYSKKSIFLSELFLRENPLSDFPKGKNAGICLHKILERYNFQSKDLDYLQIIICEELRTYGIDLSHSNSVQEAILRVTKSSLGEKLENKRLVDIQESKIIKELKYDLSISKNGEIIKSEDIAKCFCLEKEYYFGKNYSKKIKDLKIYSKGFHSGFIDCIIPIGDNLENSKWWIIDWKSNYISTNGQSKCIPQNFNYENMKKEMIKHHYPLQSHLYLLALHRLLKWRVRNYNPIRNLGGYIYIFLRGLPAITSENKFKLNGESPGIFIGNAPLKRIHYLDNLFKNGRSF